MWPLYKMKREKFILNDNITDYIYSYRHIYQYNESQIKNKCEVLEIEDRYSWGRSYICKNDICTKINVHNYEIDYLNKCTNEEYDNKKFDSCNYHVLISFKCTSDSQCLTNKCIDGYCMFNKENLTEFCTYIYSHSIFGSHSYIHCGKLNVDICKTNKECVSVKCLRNGYCYVPPDGPSDTDGLYYFIKFYLIFVPNENSRLSSI
ncbi:hypothetical protein U3516DRAFT_782681 [Neocallimastix sp. 'constans']